MKILYTGGGTMGSVSPLIAIHQQLNLKFKTLWIGTKSGPEKKIVEKQGIKFKSITAGKLRRYFDLRNLIDVFKIKLGFWQALFIILKFKPDIILSAGSFVSVPVVWAGWLLKVPSIIHQQDVQPSLTNKLMAPFATRITVALDKSLGDYPKNKVVLVGNPVRQNLKFKILNSKQMKASLSSRYTLGWLFQDNQNSKFKFQNNSLPRLLIVGGGTGALAINQLIWESLGELIKFCNIIHLTGKGKNSYQLPIINYQLQYQPFEFLYEEMYDAIQVADIVVSRAGMSTLTELAYFSKPAIIIPIPNSHQEKNAEYFAKKEAGIYLKQDELTSEKLIAKIKDLLKDKGKKEKLSKNIHKIFTDYSGEKMIEEIENILLNKKIS